MINIKKTRLRVLQAEYESLLCHWLILAKSFKLIGTQFPYLRKKGDIFLARQIELNESDHELEVTFFAVYYIINAQ